jgi:Protein of unknown function (DUF3455)
MMQPTRTAARVFAQLLLAAAGVVAGATLAGAQTPAAIAAPEATEVLTLHAEGAQIYECKAAADGRLAWAFREPIASLIRDGRTVGRHYLGPTWEYEDGSAVTGKVAASAPGANAEDIALLKLAVVGRRGSGALATIDIVQRLNTSGGALSGPCTTRGALRSAPYSADYVFLRKGS